jgi:hypothetical protein
VAFTLAILMAKQGKLVEKTLDKFFTMSHMTIEQRVLDTNAGKHLP